MVAVLIAAMGGGFTSCNKDDKKEPEPDLSFHNLRGTWYYTEMISPEQSNENFFFTFHDIDKKYFYVNDNEIINGMVKVLEKEKNIAYDFILEKQTPKIKRKTKE